jgi:hypothetical protein
MPELTSVEKPRGSLALGATVKVTQLSHCNANSSLLARYLSQQLKELLCDSGYISPVWFSTCNAVVTRTGAFGTVKCFTKEFELHRSSASKVIFAVPYTSVELINLSQGRFASRIGG